MNTLFCFSRKTASCSLALVLSVLSLLSFAQETRLVPGIERSKEYLSLLKGKRIAMMVNQTSVIGAKHSVDSLLALKLNIVRIFGPEHGFRGTAQAGDKVSSTRDQRTGIPVVSLYGSHHKPTPADLKGIEVVVFDIQDVGARFYTYISSLHYLMEACAENGIPLIVMDRPNPNGFYVDGPVLKKQYQSFIGMHPVPIVHGMTIGEYAQMINGEAWLKNGVKCKLRVVKAGNYNHESTYTLPVKPSPNLNTQQSVLLYPSLCLFEGTNISQGRGTLFPFTILGSPYLAGKYSFGFKPESIRGMAESPLYQNQVCYGLDLRTYDTDTFRKSRKINLAWLIELYNAADDKDKFFDFKQSKQIGNFDKLAGTDELRKQIIANKSEDEIRRSWEPELGAYKKMRTKYLLYP